MSQTAADVLVERLYEWGVRVVFGLPGDGINGIMEALRKRKDDIRFVQVRHEEAAAFMACGYAKFTGKLGVCLATSGPGGIHLLNGLYDAKLDQAPVLAITGLAFHDLINTHQQQDVELDKLFMDVATYNCRVMGPSHVERVTDLACRTALTYRGVAHITIPVDMQDMPAGEHRSKRNVQARPSEAPPRTTPLPETNDLEAAAAILNEGERVVILAGQGALHATDELEALAELLGAPIVKALLGKAAVPDDSPYTTGSVGLLGTRPSQDALEDCDTLLMVGTSFPYIEYYPKPGQARAVQIDLDPMRIGLRYPIDAGLVGDSQLTLQALIPLLRRHDGRGFLEKAQEGMKAWRDLMEERGTRNDTPMKPQVLARALGIRLRDDAIVACDSGTITAWWARHIPARRGQRHSVSGNLASMANGFPYAIAAQLAYPDRQVVAFVGDGGFSMLMAEFATCVKYQLPVKVVVVRNNTLGQIKWEQMVFLGNPEYGCELHPIDFAMFARACGGTGFTIEQPLECGPILEQALATPGPVIVQGIVDPFEPPMPAKISLEQARHFAESLLRGTPNRNKVALTVLSDTVRELV
ncbi:MAG TPA: thiamine pyrophosphate-dependent enzyme [Methylomirabilota bacterium]|jgi:pyruvate dehydrogenase (quinone)/pyruvate oxidase|nr:thiamine pyrophosphate-dependent enzyme [Methylomirabilota bacterium]